LNNFAKIFEAVSVEINNFLHELYFIPYFKCQDAFN
jgi:hypothetical protein